MRLHAEQRPGLGDDADKEEGDVKLTELDISHIPVELREYRVQSTGARVTLASAKPLLYMFCAKLPADRQAPLLPPPSQSLAPPALAPLLLPHPSPKNTYHVCRSVRPFIEIFNHQALPEGHPNHLLVICRSAVVKTPSVQEA